MLLSLSEYGGLVPKIKDPASLPDKHAQVALNCRFDQGGILPLNTDLQIQTTTKTDPKSLFVYYNEGNKYFFQWLTDVNAVKTPLANDSFNRVFYTENGKLRVTDSDLFNQGGTDYPMISLNPCPPVPTNALIITGNPSSDIMSLLIVDSSCTESDGVHALIFTGGTGALGVYSIAANIIISVFLYVGGSGYISNVTVKTQSGLGEIQAVLHDQTLLETRGYVYTFVNQYGEEGPPSPASNLIAIYEGNAVTISKDSIHSFYAIQFIKGNEWIVGGRLIQSIDNSANGTIGHWVIISGTLADGDAAGTLYLMEWNGQPFDLNDHIYYYKVSYGSLVIVCTPTSQPSNTPEQDLTDYAIVKERIYRINQAASGSAQYQFVVELPIEADSYYDTLLDSALAEVLPSLEWDAPPDGITGLIALPNGMLAGFVDNLFCVSVANYPHAWPVSYQKPVDKPIVGLSSFGMNIIVLTEGSPYLVIGNDPANLMMEKVEGLACVSKEGIVIGDQVTCYPSTEGLSAIGPGVSKVATTPLMTLQDWTSLYYPTTLVSFYWEGKYIGFYDKGGGIRAGFMFDPTKGDLVDLDFYATAGYYDSADGTLYLVINNNIVAFNQGTTYRIMNWISRLYRYRLNVFKCAKIIAKTYPYGNPLTADLIYPTLNAAVTINVLSSKPIRLPQFMSEACEIRVYGNKQTSVIHIANSLEEFPE